MNVIVRSKEYVKKVLRKNNSQTLDSAEIKSPVDGSIITSNVIVNNSSTETLLTSVSRGEDSISCNNLEAGEYYDLVSTSGKTIRILVIGVTGTICELSTLIPFDISGGTVKEITSTITFTIPDTYLEKSLLLNLGYSNSKNSTEYIVANQELYNPVSNFDLYTFYGRAEGLEPEYQRRQGIEFTPQIDNALKMLRSSFWIRGLVLDNLKSAGAMKQLLLLRVGMLLVQSGYDLNGSNDFITQYNDIEIQYNKEFNRIVKSSPLWIDEDEDDLDDGVKKPKSGRLIY